MAEVDCTGKTVTEINKAIREGLDNDGSITVRSPASRHNLGVGINQPGTVIFDGNVGYFCAGMLKLAQVEIRGNAGWSVGSDMMSGSIVVRGNASAAAGAAIRGGSLVVHGSAGPRTGISQKGGTIVVGGDIGYMSAFIMQKGVIVVCGNTGEALADSIYEGKVFVRGHIDDTGNGATREDFSTEDTVVLGDLLSRAQIEGSPTPDQFVKIVTDKRLYNFDVEDFELWRVAL